MHESICERMVGDPRTHLFRLEYPASRASLYSCPFEPNIHLMPSGNNAAASWWMKSQGFGGNDEHLRKCMIEYFMGGEVRTAKIKELLTELHEKHGCRLCVLTRGEAAALRIFFELVAPDWAPLFEGGWIGDTSNNYFTVNPSRTSGGARGLNDESGGGYVLSGQAPNLSTVGRYGECTKELILESVFPFVRARSNCVLQSLVTLDVCHSWACDYYAVQTENAVMLVDDSISSGGSLVASSAPGNRGGKLSLLDLPIEQDGRELPFSTTRHSKPDKRINFQYLAANECGLLSVLCTRVPSRCCLLQSTILPLSCFSA
eukprot:COSAG02_NODE_932_length_15816_cov_15.913088_4_plen_317_part_00